MLSICKSKIFLKQFFEKEILLAAIFKQNNNMGKDFKFFIFFYKFTINGANHNMVNIIILYSSNFYFLLKNTVSGSLAFYILYYSTHSD